MQIKRILNNNAIVYIGEHGEDTIAIGKGLGYGKRIGDEVDPDHISKLFVIKDEKKLSKLEQLLKDIPLEYVTISQEVLESARKQLNININDILVVSLSDHLYAAVQRTQEGLEIKNDLLWEIHRFYEVEYKIGLKAVNLVAKRIGVKLPEAEAGFVAMHIINTEISDDVGSDQVNQITRIIQDITNIVRRFFGIDFDTESVYYYRFITHLKFFAERMLKGNSYDDDTDHDLLNVLKKRYVNAFECTERIRTYLTNNYSYHLTTEEETYLMIHIQRVVYKTDKKG